MRSHPLRIRVSEKVVDARLEHVMAARLLCANWRCNYLQHPNVAEFSGFCCKQCQEWSKNPRRKLHHGRKCQKEKPETPTARASEDLVLSAAVPLEPLEPCPGPETAPAPAVVDVSRLQQAAGRLEKRSL